MTATRLRRHGKRAFLALLAASSIARAGEAPDPGWRLTVIPAFERPARHEKIPGSETAIIAAAREKDYGEIEYATTPAAWRCARKAATTHGETWLERADIQVRRDNKRVIDRVLITGDDPLLASLPLTPAFYSRFEPILGDGFYVVIPDRNTIALYPRLAGRIPPEEAAMLLERNRMAVNPLSGEVFTAKQDGLKASGVLTDE